MYMHEDLSMLQRCIPNSPKSGVGTPYFWVVSFGFLSICPFVGKFVCLVELQVLCAVLLINYCPFTDFKDVVLSKFLCLHESRRH